MAGGFKDFVGGDVLTAADVDDFLMRQTVMKFASAATRDSNLSGVLAEGLVAYLSDVNTFTMYTGSVWVDIATMGAWTAYTPAVTNWTLGNGTSVGSYQKVGRLVNCRGLITLGSTSNLTGILITSVPVAPAAGQWAFGGVLADTSAAILSPCAWSIGASGSQLQPYVLSAVTQLNNAGITNLIPWTWANPDYISWNVSYEAAS